MISKGLPNIMPGAEPVFHRGGPTGILCLHGLTATPDEVRWLADHLAGAGHTVSAPRMAGHGTHHRDLQHTRWGDWYTSALDAYYVLRAQCERVVVGGLSMGALVALLLAASQPVDGVYALAAPLELSGARSRRTVRLVGSVRPFVPMPDDTNFPRRLRTEQLRRGEPNRGRVRYDIWSTQAVVELYDLMDVVRGQLGQVTAPACLVYSEADGTVPVYNRDLVAAGLGSAQVETHTLKDSGHILTQDSECEAVFATVADFVAGIGVTGP
jgi:carboxylesterase